MVGDPDDAGRALRERPASLRFLDLGLPGDRRLTPAITRAFVLLGARARWPSSASRRRSHIARRRANQSSARRRAFGSRRQVRTRPVFAVTTTPDSSSNRRCWWMAGNDMSNGLASSVTDASPSARRSTMARRVGSAMARNTRSRTAAWLSIYLSTDPGEQGVEPEEVRRGVARASRDAAWREPRGGDAVVEHQRSSAATQPLVRPRPAGRRSGDEPLLELAQASRGAR